ncbi:ABC transporter permease [Lysinibacillus antri]|uniref:Transport permease protein n=1 Tax=Lysinibacillus antri TaxID=2498145 RepID=A0A3S0P5X9_9BACI|nr:ABC transporter permease [Lysinibacillus antri]RUL47909.1 ABC transporter permease [Lysinibacillus antri]
MASVIFNSMIKTSLRDKISVFYGLVFPIGLLILLGWFFDQETMSIRILTGVTAISTLFWGMQGIAFQVFSQRNKGVYKLLKLTPMPIIRFVFTMMLARTVVGVVMNMIVWFVGVVVLHVEISWMTIVLTSFLVFVGTLCFTSLGFLIANFAQNEAQINVFSNLIQLPMIFMSEAFYSLNNLPEWIQVVGKLLPFEYYTKGLSATVTKEIYLLGFAVPFISMIGILILAALTFKWDEKQVDIKIKKKYA